MSNIQHSVDVGVPVRTAYDQWTQFESFPEFMDGVESVKQLDNTRLVWAVEIGGVRREFEAEITEQHPDERVAWRSLEQPHQAGVVTFHRLDADTTRVTLQMEYDPTGFVETAGDWLQIVRTKVKRDLERFKEFIESRGGETGAWRGDVPAPHQRGEGTTTPQGTGAAPGYDVGEPMPAPPVGSDRPVGPGMPAPGSGPVSPTGNPRWDEEPPGRLG